MAREYYSLAWQAHPAHIQDMMIEMMTSTEFADVTLVSEDRKHIKTHRNILSACSPVLKDILLMDKSSTNTFIYLRGIQHSELESILKYIFLGEATLHVERMNEFFSAAKNLKIKELCEDEKSGTEILNQDEKLTTTETLDVESEEEEKEVLTESREKKIETDKLKEPSLEKAKLNDDKTEIERIGTMTGMSDEVKYACNECDYQSRSSTKWALIRHIKAQHQNIKYDCQDCNYQAKYSGDLRKHIKSVHEQIKYGCNHCGKVYASLSNLNYHLLKAKH